MKEENSKLVEGMRSDGITMHELAKKLDALTIEGKNKGIKVDLELPLITLGESSDPIIQLTIQIDALQKQLDGINPKKEFKDNTVLSSEFGVDLDWNRVFNKKDFDGEL